MSYPAGVDNGHPHFNPPAEVECECGEEVFPGEECPKCGTYQPTDEERREDES